MEDDYVLDLDLAAGGGVPVNLEQDFELCEELLKRYGKSGGKVHQIVCASASALRIELKEKGVPLNPLSYLDATISAIGDTPSSPINPKSTSSLACFLTNLLVLIPSQSLSSLKANDIVTLLVSMLKKPQSPFTIICLIRSLGFLIELCDLEDWNFAKSVFEMILEFSIDKQQQDIRECAQVCAEKIYKAVVQCTNVVNEASELFYSMLFYKYLPCAIAVSWSRIEITEDSEQAHELMLMESVHMLNVLKLIVLYLSNGVVTEVMDHIHMIMGSKYSLLTGPNFALLETILKSPRAEEIIVPKTEIVIFALGNYVSPKENNPVDTVLSASILLKRCIDKLHAHKRSIWLINLPLVFEAIAGVVGAGLSVSEEAAGILKELVNQHIDDELKISASDATLPDRLTSTPESKALESVCAAIDKMQLTNSDGELNKELLSVVSHMFLKLGELSYSYLKGVVHQLTELRRVGDTTRTKYQHLEDALAVLEQNRAAFGAMNPALAQGAFGMGNPMYQNPQGPYLGGPSGQGPAKRPALGPTGGYVAR